MKYMLIAGEASGDLHASNLINSLKKLIRMLISVFGGDLTAKAARKNPEIHYEMMNVMGFSEVLRKLPTLLQPPRTAKRIVAEYRPDVLILVGLSEFHLKLQNMPIH